ncbi:capsid protein [Enterocloster lavalensis]|uniref:capsid protein n=1 Tax=Enterocloster lavalensis TaxID=460384 RepID=UPI0034A26DD0
MRWTQKLSDNIKRGIRSWLNIQPAGPYNIQIQEIMDFELSAIRSRIWYRGDGNELEQFYQQSPEAADRFKFWASRCTPGMEMRKIHTGLPGLIVRILSSIILSSMNDFEFSDQKQESLWQEIEKENKFRKGLEEALKEALYIGDGAYKVTIDTALSEYPILEWYPGDQIEIIRQRGRVKEVIFKTPITDHRQEYTLYEYYGYGYIRNELYRGNTLVDHKAVEATKGLTDWKFDNKTMLAVPIKIYESAKWQGRGGSIFDGKLDSFDAFDETWSQWMDALRAGRAKEYIPECFLPRNPTTGEVLAPNHFDNRYIKTDQDMGEGTQNKIDVEQPAIPHDSYLASYITALDLCLQGIISPSTLGIDVKKLDNAEAQREKEKTTLYTRDAIVEALQEELPAVIGACINAYHLLHGEAVEEVKVDIPFGEYANPSFESQVETLTKARPGAPVMSVEAQVEELYGDSKDEAWKKEEIARLKAEQGIAVVEEPGVNLAAGGFQVNMEGGIPGEGQSNEPPVPDESKGVPGTAPGGQGAGAIGNIRPGKE